MQHLLLLTFLGLGLLQPLVQAFFLGPVAVGAALGALFITKGLIIGAALSSRRTRQQSYSRRRRSHYQPRNHYVTRYSRSYSQPTTYYYSSEPHYRSSRGKRSVVDTQALDRVRREVRETFNEAAWYLEMVEKDQDDCTKRLVCELAARSAARQMVGVEAELSRAFGLGNSIDVSSSKAVFDIAAQAGKLMGVKRCEEFYRRCQTPVDEILAMINTELEEFTKVEEDVMLELNPLAAVEEVSEKEKKDLAQELGVAEQLLWN